MLVPCTLNSYAFSLTSELIPAFDEGRIGCLELYEAQASFSQASIEHGPFSFYLKSSRYDYVLPSLYHEEFLSVSLLRRRVSIRGRDTIESSLLQVRAKELLDGTICELSIKHRRGILKREVATSYPKYREFWDRDDVWTASGRYLIQALSKAKWKWR
jgi:hypothetical protein